MPDRNALVARLKGLQVKPIVVGILICYAAQFVGTFISVILQLFSPHAIDAFTDPHMEAAIARGVFFRTFVEMMLQLAGYTAAGFVAAHLASGRRADQAVGVGLIFMGLNLPYILSVSHMAVAQQAPATAMWGWWLALVLTVPAAYLGARLWDRYAG